MKAGKIVLRILKIFGVVVLVLVGLVLLPLLIGFIVDLAVTPQWNEAQKESVDYFAKLRSEKYSSVPLSFVTLDGNAWDYYARASKEITDRSSILDVRLGKDSLEISRAESLVQKYEKAFALFDSGACCRYYYIPIDYRKGSAKPLLIGNIESLLRLAIIKGRLEQAKGANRTASEIYSKALKMSGEVGNAGEVHAANMLGADISPGGNIFVGRMVGIILGDVARYQISSDLNLFDLESVILLKEAVTQLEQNWPPLDSAVEAKGRLLLLPSVSGWDGSDFTSIWFASDSLAEPAHYTISIIFADINSWDLPSFARKPVYTAHKRVMFSLMAWRHLFSVRKSTRYGVQRLFDLAKSYRNNTDKRWVSMQALVKKAEDAELDEFRKGEASGLVAYASHFWIYTNYYEDQFRTRVLKSALWLREYKLKHKKYPEPLVTFLASDTAYYDLADNKPLHFVRDSINQTIRLYSVGLNMKDEQGKSSWSEPDDIWIELK